VDRDALGHDIVIVQNMNEVWWPAQGINTIGMWDNHTGYKIKLSDNTSLQIAGYSQAEKTMMLTAGWNLMPVLSSGAVSCADLFDGQMDDLIIVKELAGVGIYWPGEEIASLENLSPSKAYLVKVATDMTISFEGLSAATPEKPVNSTREGWDLLPPTGNSHVIALPASLLNIFEIGDQIGVFTAEGACAGYVEVENYDDNLALVVCGNDSTTTEHDGLNADEMFSFKMYRSSTNLEYALISGFDQSMPNQGFYTHEGLSKFESLVFDNTGIIENDIQASIYPNPTDEQVYVSIPEGNKAQLEIFNMSGQVVLQMTVKGNTAIQTVELPKGIYTFRITGESFSQTHKVIFR